MSVVKQFPVSREYEKNPDISREDIEKLREWLAQQPHLPGDFLEELDLLLVYHCCERSAEVSKQVLDLHYTLRTLFTDFFGIRQFDRKIEHSLNTTLFALLPGVTVRGHRAVYARLIDYEPRNFIFPDVIKSFMMMFDLWQYEEGTWPGFVIVVDLDRALIGHIARVEVMAIKKVLYFLQECMLCKLREVHFMNAPYFMDKLMMLLKPFMSKALLDMIHIHQPGAASLNEYIAQASFPKDAGGEYKSFDCLRDEQIDRVRANKEFYEMENKRRVKESLRPGGKRSAAEDEFGIQGSFKKLDID